MESTGGIGHLYPLLVVRDDTDSGFDSHNGSLNRRNFLL